jgi:hypothetical protein
MGKKAGYDFVYEIGQAVLFAAFLELIQVGARPAGLVILDQFR